MFRSRTFPIFVLLVVVSSTCTTTPSVSSTVFPPQPTTTGQPSSPTPELTALPPTPLPLPPTNTPAPTPTASPEPFRVPTLAPDIQSKGEGAEVFCSTDNEQARRAYNGAKELERQAQVKQAEQMYLKALDLDPGYCDAMDNLGLLLRRQGKVAEAIEWYEKSIKVLPTNAVAHQNLGVAYRIQGRIPEAIAEYELLTQIDPNNPEGYYGLGQIYLDTDQLQKAAVQLKKAAALYAEKSSPLVTDAHYALGATHYMLGECKTAIDYLNLAYPEMKEEPGLNYFLGLSYLCPDSLNIELARRYLKKAQELGVKLPAEVLPVLGQ